jgi:hypothetical protein
MDDSDHKQDRDQIAQSILDLVEKLEADGACPCCVNTALLMVVLAGGECADAIRSLSPHGVFELRDALNRAVPH